jgi:hypothetical protein
MTRSSRPRIGTELARRFWAGEGVGQIRPSGSAAQLIEALETETEEAIRALAGLLV